MGNPGISQIIVFQSFLIRNLFFTSSESRDQKRAELEKTVENLNSENVHLKASQGDLQSQLEAMKAEHLRSGHHFIFALKVQLLHRYSLLSKASYVTLILFYKFSLHNSLLDFEGVYKLQTE